MLKTPKELSRVILEHPERNRRYVFRVFEDLTEAVSVEKWENKLLSYRRVYPVEKGRTLYKYLTNVLGYERW